MTTKSAGPFPPHSERFERAGSWRDALSFCSGKLAYELGPRRGRYLGVEIIGSAALPFPGEPLVALKAMPRAEELAGTGRAEKTAQQFAGFARVPDQAGHKGKRAPARRDNQLHRHRSCQAHAAEQAAGACQARPRQKQVRRGSTTDVGSRSITEATLGALKQPGDAVALAVASLETDKVAVSASPVAGVMVACRQAGRHSCR